MKQHQIAEKWCQARKERCQARLFRDTKARRNHARHLFNSASPSKRACAHYAHALPVRGKRSVGTVRTARQRYGLTARAAWRALMELDMKRQARWVSESEVQWAARLFAERGTAIIGSSYGKPCKRVTIAGISSFQIERLKDRFDGNIGPDRWRCDGVQATAFLKRIKKYTSVTLTARNELPDSEAPRCGQPTKHNTPCERVARTDLGYTTCWTHRPAE